MWFVCSQDTAETTSEDEGASSDSDHTEFHTTVSANVRAQQTCYRQGKVSHASSSSQSSIRSQPSALQTVQNLQKAHPESRPSPASSQPLHLGATLQSKNTSKQMSSDPSISQQHAASGMNDAGQQASQQHSGQSGREQHVHPLQQGPSQPAATQQQALSGDQLAVLYSSCLKLASENKIDKHNSWQLGLIDHLVSPLHHPPFQQLRTHACLLTPCMQSSGQSTNYPMSLHVIEVEPIARAQHPLGCHTVIWSA